MSRSPFPKECRAGSSAAYFPFRFHDRELARHVRMNVAPKRNLDGFANACRWIGLRFLLENQRHRLKPGKLRSMPAKNRRSLL